MAKTKRKQLAALAAVNESIPVTTTDGENHKMDPPTAEQSRCSRKTTLREHSPETEVRHQRVIIWIPPAIPTSRSEASTNVIAQVLTNGTPSRKRNRNSDKSKAAGNERGRINKSFSKVIFKVGNWREEKIIKEARPSLMGPTAVVETDKISQRSSTKTGSDTSPTKKTKTQRVVFNIPSLCEEADGAIPIGNSQDPPGGETQGIAEESNVEGESLMESPTTLSKRKTPRRKAGSLKGLLAANPLFQSPPPGQREEELPLMSRGGVDAIMGGNEQARVEKKKGPTSVRKQENTLDRRRERALGVPLRHSKRLAKESPRKELLTEPAAAQTGVEASTRDFHPMKMTETIQRISGSPPGMVLPTSVSPSTVPISADPQQTGSVDVTPTTEKLPQHVLHVKGSTERDASGRVAPIVDPSILQQSMAPQSLPLSTPSLVKEALTLVGTVETVVQSQTRLLRSGRMIDLQPGTIPPQTLPSERSSYTPSPLPNSSGKAGTATRSLLAAAAQISNAVTVPDAEKNTKLQAPDHATCLLAFGFKATTSSGNHLTCGMESNTVTPTGLQTIRSVSGLAEDKETWCKGNKLPVQHAYSGMIQSGLGKINGQAIEKPISATTCIQDKEINFPGAKQNSHEGIAAHPQAAMCGVNHFLPPKLSSRPLQMPEILNSELALSKQVNRVAVVKAKLEEGGGLTDWLVEHGLGVFVGLFEERHVDEGALLQLTMEDLKEMGVHAVGPRRKLIWAIENL
ncbi:unnamed protein product [Sphagnum tenellum]